MVKPGKCGEDEDDTWQPGAVWGETSKPTNKALVDLCCDQAKLSRGKKIVGQLAVSGRTGALVVGGWWWWQWTSQSLWNENREHPT